MSFLLNSDRDTRNVYLGYVKDLLLYFVKNARMIYGETFLSNNVHALCHLADDVNNFVTTLNEISGFSFENHLQKKKNK